ncbi:hypothetical protein ANCCAN_11897 [Ancylostoma caninum]|uniref:Uncharacterized protein n=1 Tax=Ancylostoma caninum TaxID=29170 RepID=A0A368GGM4_ANCCA|nr:hypothetical protein ANCCAN_11897 [Ancylostoma caninum]
MVRSVWMGKVKCGRESRHIFCVGHLQEAKLLPFSGYKRGFPVLPIAEQKIRTFSLFNTRWGTCDTCVAFPMA